MALTFLLLTFCFVYITGQCGYPGQPLNGTTYLRVNSQRMNQKKLQNAFNEAVYFCDDNHLLTENTKKLRVCENGMWNGELPQCVEIRSVWQFFQWGHWNTGCRNLDSHTPYTFSTGMFRRLHGIQFTAINDPCFNLENMAWTIEGQRTDQSGWEHLRIERRQFYHTHEHRIISVYFDGSIYFKSLRLFINHFHFQVCNVELLAFHDECGHPEVPLNGRVQWNPGDTEAIYRCDDGYQLNVPSATRQCVQGKWNGLQPICVSQKSGRTTPRLTTIASTLSYTQSLTTQRSEVDWGRIATVDESPGSTETTSATTIAPLTTSVYTLAVTIACCVLILIIVAVIIAACRNMQRNLKDRRSFEAAMARANPPIGRVYNDVGDDSTLQSRPSLEHQYAEIRDSQVRSTRRPIPEGLEGYEIANHFL